MKKQFINLLMLGGLALWAGCSDDDEKIDDGMVGNPECVFNSETGEYKVRLGKEALLSAHVTNAANPVYSWKQEGEIMSGDTLYYFKGERLGETFVNFRVEADNGSVERQVKVTTVERLTPEIKLGENAVGYCGVPLTLAAETDYTDETTTFEWSYEGKVVNTDSICTFQEEDICICTLALKVTNADGVDVKNISISVIPEEKPFIFFDNGRYVESTHLDQVITMTCPVGKHVVLAPVRFGISDEATYEWKVDGQVQDETSLYFDFTPATQGVTYEIEVTAKDGSNTATTKVKVQCTPPEGTYFRETTAESSYLSNYCYEFIPAPGQFINFPQGKTKEDARLQIQNQLNQGKGETGYLASLGAWGGYFILKFDHSVRNNHDGEADFDMTGNPLGKNWCECGVVWVSQDENGDGIPNDTWYELKGSETGKPGVTQRYALKYYKPTAEKTDVLSIDNNGNLNFLRRNAYHPESGYFPWFMEGDYYILTGTCLGNQFETAGIEVNFGFDWGYVDNVNDPTGFRIDNAIHQDGTPAELEYIDFVKCHTGQMGQGTAVGEVSTESSAAIDVRLREQRK